MKTKIITASFLALLFVGCSNKGDDDRMGEILSQFDPEVPTETVTETESHSGEIKLDDGEKWLVNEEMKPHVVAAEETLKEYISSGDTDYVSLSKKLNEQNESSIQSCTMQGEGHNQLHEWLHPHIDLLKELSDEKDAEKATDLVLQIKTSFETYHKYFK